MYNGDPGLKARCEARRRMTEYGVGRGENPRADVGIRPYGGGHHSHISKAASNMDFSVYVPLHEVQPLGQLNCRKIVVTL